MTIEEIKQEVNECIKCKNLIHCKDANMTPAIMDHMNASVLFILQNPGVPLDEERGKSYEDVLINSRQGKIFLNKFLEKTNLKYEDIYWSNICKCPSPENRSLEKEEMDNCYNVLVKQLQLLKNIKTIIIMGKQAIDYIKEHPLNTQCRIINFVHPAYIFRGHWEMIDELAQKVTGTKEENSELIQIQQRFNTLYEFYRNKYGIKKCNIIDFNSYFYVKEEDLDKTLNYIKTKIEWNPKYPYEPPKIEKGFQSIYNENLVRIIPDKWKFWKIKKMLWKEEIQTYEYSLDSRLKYLLSNNKTFSKTRHFALLDIENDMSLDVENAPAEITAITLYDYSTQIYHTWILDNKIKQPILNRLNEKENLYKFDDEKKMLVDFINKFRSLDLDCLGGWNLCDFDIPYIIHRLQNLDLNPNLLSNFSEIDEKAVETRSYTLYTKKGKRTHFNTMILGLECLDFIPILAKATCYKSQPSSWSLLSCSQFFLGEDSQKLINIGAEAWKTNINDFITYNIRDVQIVRELIDKFKLIDFILMVQTEITPVTLDCIYHNSVVLLHYLKFLFPNVMMPDNPGYKYLENEKIDLRKYKIKMKAAHVIPAVAGIHENVSIYDFAQLYSSIFMSLNISPETLNEKDGVEIDDIVMWKKINTLDDSEDEVIEKEDTGILKEYVFKKRYRQDIKGRYPILLKNMIDRRILHKNKAKEYKKLYGGDDDRTILEESRSDYIKQVVNSIYGCSGFNKTVLFQPQIGASVTSISRKAIKFVESWLNNQPGCKVLSGDTDSVFVCHPEQLDVIEFEKKLNEQIKNFIFSSFPQINRDNYKMYFEYAKSFSKFVMKDAKKKYYGVIKGGPDDGKFYVKGFDLIQHVMSKKVKKIIENIYVLLMNREDPKIIKDKLKEYKKEFYNFSWQDLGQDLRLANDPDKYTTNVKHARAAYYSNKYLGTNFVANSIGKLLMIKDVDNSSGKYPKTDVVFVSEDVELPNAFKLDYESMWQKLVLDKINLLESIDEMKIKELLNPNKTLSCYF
jgi:uracil-DNA glycosylase family 4